MINKLIKLSKQESAIHCSIGKVHIKINICETDEILHGYDTDCSTALISVSLNFLSLHSPYQLTSQSK